MRGGYIPSFCSPETPQGILYVFATGFHRGVTQLGGIARDAQEMKNSALRKSQWTAWSYAYSSTAMWVFLRLCAEEWEEHTPGTSFSNIVTRTGHFQEQGFPLSPYLGRLKQSSRAVLLCNPSHSSSLSKI